jgi:hypothetical protein
MINRRAEKALFCYVRKNGWRMADGRWRMADGGWRMADGENKNAICHLPSAIRISSEEL